MHKKRPRNNPRNRTPRTVQSAGTVLQRVIQRASANISLDNQLLEYIQARLPAALRPHVVRVVGKAGELVILADSAAWAARLRLVSGELGLADFERIIVKVAPGGATAR